MRVHPDQPAFPVVGVVDREAGGLTKREHFAALAMQAIASRDDDLYATDIAQLAVMHADRLIAALNEERTP